MLHPIKYLSKHPHRFYDTCSQKRHLISRKGQYRVMTHENSHNTSLKKRSPQFSSIIYLRMLYICVFKWNTCSNLFLHFSQACWSSSKHKLRKFSLLTFFLFENLTHDSASFSKPMTFRFLCPVLIPHLHSRPSIQLPT